jgi:hypothetical protein
VDSTQWPQPSMHVAAAPKSQPEAIQPFHLYRLWVLFGVISLTLFGYVMVRWATSSNFKPTGTGSDPVVWSQKAWAWSFTVISGIAFCLCIVYLVRQCRLARRLTFDTLLFVAWLVVVWQDPGGNYFRVQTLYNSYLLNMGSWSPYIPGWLSPNGARFPEPILLYGFVYPTTGLLVAVLASAAMRRAKRRWPTAGLVGVLLIGFLVCALADLVLENAWIHTGLYQDAGVIKGISILGGDRTQFPLYSPILWGSVWLASGAMRYFRDSRGDSFVERGIGDRSTGRIGATGLRFLALLGFLSVVYFGYNLAYSDLSLYGGSFPKGYPSYMLNGMCGPGTDVACQPPKAPPVG